MSSYHNMGRDAANVEEISQWRVVSLCKNTTPAITKTWDFITC